MQADAGRRWHFVGMGGAGMSALASILLAMGERVSGCDRKDGEALARLRQQGAEVFLGHDPAHLAERPIVVVSSAIRQDEPELLAARAMGLTVRPRGELLASLFDGRRGVAVCGTHGKSTTTGMIATALRAAGHDPTVVLGADLPELPGNGRLGRDPLIVAEADESDGSFTHIRPTVAVVTNVDDDHLDHYGSMVELVRAFDRFAGNASPEGGAVLCADDPRAAGLAPGRRRLTYGVEAAADLVAREVALEPWGSEFVAVLSGRRLGRVRLRVPGLHNVANALGALGAGLLLGERPDVFMEGLSRFPGVARRFQVLGRVGGVTVIDDYAHHPTEVAATLKAARAVTPGRLVVLFQPHRFTRTKNLARDFGPALALADLVYLVPIYSAGEDPLPGVDARLILEAVDAAGRRARLLGDRRELVAEVAELVRPGDVVMVMGAGDIRRDGETLVSLLSARAPAGAS
ncbi:MAG: UDP-N-acetylmuramate--L-alanine ligase [Clostridia bacterium]|nr:UDP-N-acetylmuramate--L-alanine ligase [Clostridia bacterium]